MVSSTCFDPALSDNAVLLKKKKLLGRTYLYNSSEFKCRMILTSHVIISKSLLPTKVKMTVLLTRMNQKAVHRFYRFCTFFAV